jgi:hypothetical protein
LSIGAVTRHLHQGPNITFVKLHPGTALETTGQHHGAVSDTNQAAHGMAYGFKHAANFTVAPLRNGDAVPAVGPFAATRFN